MNRRGFLSLDAKTPRRPSNGNGAVLNNGGSNSTQHPPAFARRTTAGLEPYTGTWGYAQAAHLLRRSMVGPTDAEIRKALSDGMDTTVTNLMKPHSVATDMIQTWAGQDPQVTPQRDTPTSAPTQAQLDTFNTLYFTHRDQLTRWSLKNLLDAPVSIQERMVLFWMNHFVIEAEVVNFAEFQLTWNQLIRQYCLGNFKKFAYDITIDLGMLIYLNGNQNYKSGTRDNINENYGRELMELFTMGINDPAGNSNYSQTDVHEAARSLSGWVNSPSTKTPVLNEKYSGLTSMFISTRWDSATKTYLGQTGVWKAQDVIDILFAQRADAVASFICAKLYSEFVYAVPDPAVVAQMAQTFKTNWEIQPVMEQLLRSAHFYDVTNIGALDKSPIDYMLGAVRGLSLTNVPDFLPGLSGRGAQELTGRLTAQGQVPLDPPNVKGWPGARVWISTSTVPTRQKFMLDVMDAKIKARINSQQQTIYQFDAVAFAKTFPNPSDLLQLSTDMGRYLLNIDPSGTVDKDNNTGTGEAWALYNAILDNGKWYEWNIDDVNQRPAERIAKFIKAAVQLAKYQLY